jgi:glycine dehydrogenase subunit 2
MPKTIFELSVKGRKAITLPKNEIDYSTENKIPAKFLRKSETHLPEVSELDVMRHFIKLSHMNHFIEKGFYPLGSCTMKYNPKLNESLANNDKFNNLHPLQNEETVQGALEILYDLQKDLTEISGMDAVSLQPVAGAHGEFTGIKVIRAYHIDKGNDFKDTIILPDSAHGTNPATSTLNGYKVVEIKSNDKGMVDIEELKKVANENTAAFMLTNPNTLGIFESQIEEIAEIIHSVGGLMYMDGANFNALLGLVQPGRIGFDVMHYNLHKTFSTPHGGGGPGSGPIGVRLFLEKYLPVPIVKKNMDRFYLDYSNEDTTIGKVQAFYGNFAINLRAYVYVKMLGSNGLKRISENAIINANYIKAKLQNIYDVPFIDNCMHEFVISGEKHKKAYGIKTLDIAKRLLDKGYHAPTIYFPNIVHESIMIEPTETESKQTLDKFINSMIEIDEECKKNPEIVKNAPTNAPIKRVDDAYSVKHLNVKYEF